MRVRNTIIVLVLFALVGGYAWLVSHESVEETVKLFQIKSEDITKIDLRYPDREIEVERGADGKWSIIKPIKTDADETTANNLARAIAECELKRTVDEAPADLKPFGLDKPEVIVTVTTRSKGVLPAISVGKTTPVGFSAYIKTADSRAVKLTSSAFPPGMQKKVDDLRDRELMAFKVDDVQRVTLEREGEPAVELVREGERWNIVKPARYAADPTQVRQLLSALANARIDQFIDDFPTDVSRLGLEKPRLTVTVFTGKEGPRQSLLFGAKQTEPGKDGIYVRRGERAPVYTVHGYVFSDANRSLFDLRDKTVLGFEPSAVQRVNVRNASGSFALERAPGGNWLVTNGTKADAGVAVVERLLEQLHDLKGQSIVEDPIRDPKKFGLDKPAEDLSLIAKDGKHLGSLSLAKVERRNEEPAAGTAEAAGPVQRTDYYVFSSTGRAVYTIDDFTFGELNKTAEQFRARPAASPAPTPRR